MVKKLLKRLGSFEKSEYSDNKYTSENSFGYINIEKIRGKTWEISNISINIDLRKKGYGKKLIKHTFKFMKKQGATGVLLNSPVEEATGFWNKMGFRDVNKRMKL